MRFDIQIFSSLLTHILLFFFTTLYQNYLIKNQQQMCFSNSTARIPLLQSLRFVYKILLPELKDTVNFLNSYLLRTYPTMFILLDLQEIKAESAAERVYSQSHRVGRWENKPQTCLHKGKGLEYLQDNQSGSRAA